MNIEQTTAIMAQATDVALVTSVFIFTLLAFNATARKATWAVSRWTCFNLIFRKVPIGCPIGGPNPFGKLLIGTLHAILVLTAGITPLYVM